MMFRKRLIGICRRSMTTKDNSILVEKLGLITTIAINRPSKRNCIDHATANMLEDALSSFEADNTSSVAVLHGIGGNFCSGFDLQEIGESDAEGSGLKFSVLPSRSFVKKPMVAALSGYAVAGGLELALLCDLRVMEDTAVIGLYGRRFGIPLTDGATVRLPAIVGLSRALDLILSGRSLSAKEAFDWGLVNRIVACGTGLGQALQLATCLTKFPQDCLNSDRNSTYNAAFSQVYDELLKHEKEKAKSVNVRDIIQGAKRFLSGVGKHGKSYNLTERKSMDWEEEYNKISKSKL